MTGDEAVTHPFPAGTRVRHDGRRYSREAFATVVEFVDYGVRGIEYIVDVDADSGWITAGERTLWAHYHTHLGEP